MNGAQEVLLPKAVAAASGGSAILTFIAQNAALPFFGVGITTLGMAVAGSLLAFAYGTPVKGWGKLFGYAIGGMFLGIWGVKLVPTGMDWKWYFDAGPAVMEPPLAGVIALISRWLIPLVVENLPAIWNRVFNSARSPGETK